MLRRRARSLREQGGRCKTRAGSRTREPGPGLVPIPRTPDEVGAVIIEDKLWRAVGGKL
jgi:hypothetical protein